MVVAVAAAAAAMVKLRYGSFISILIKIIKMLILNSLIEATKPIIAIKEILLLVIRNKN